MLFTLYLLPCLMNSSGYNYELLSTTCDLLRRRSLANMIQSYLLLENTKSLYLLVPATHL